MSRKAYLALFAAAALAAACTKEAAPILNEGSGERFVPEVVDWAGDVGVDPSLSVNSEGQPVITYLGFKQVLDEGEIADSRPLHLPALPNVIFADRTDGFWDIGPVAWMREAGARPEGDPALEVEGGDGQLEPLPTASQDSVVDDGGVLHVVWTDAEGVKYANDASDTFDVVTVTKAPGAFGVSIAVTPSGDPWIAYYKSRSLVEAATIDERGRWISFPVGKANICEAPECGGFRTDVAAAARGPVIAYSDGRGPLVASAVGEADDGPAIDRIEPGGGGSGISLALAGDGQPYIAYYSGVGDVKLAHGPLGGGTWSVDEIAKGSASEGTPFGWGTGIALAGDTAFLTWYDLPTNSVKLAKAEGGTTSEIPTASTDGGTSPSVATGEEGAIYLAWYDATSQDAQFGEVTSADDIPIAVVSPSPAGGGAVAPPPPAAECSPTILTVTAPVGAAASGFDPTCLAAKAGKPFTIEFDNQDAGVPHNVAVFTDSSASQNLATGKIITGPAKDSISVDAQKPGSLFFRCDVHPTTMTGTLVIA